MDLEVGCSLTKDEARRFVRRLDTRIVFTRRTAPTEAQGRLVDAHQREWFEENGSKRMVRREWFEENVLRKMVRGSSIGCNLLKLDNRSVGFQGED